MIDIFVINLEKNKDRKQFIIDSYDKYFNLHFIDAVYDKRPNKGCFLSHIKCIQHAKDNNMEYIIVMEDDCQNRNDNFVKELEDTLIYLKQNKEKWDIFLGGTTNVYPKNMDKNLKLTKGLFFSQRVLLELTSSGYTREKSYKIVQKIALQSWKNNTDFLKNLENNKLITDKIPVNKLRDLFNFSYHTKKINIIFKRSLKK